MCLPFASALRKVGSRGCRRRTAPVWQITMASTNVKIKKLCNFLLAIFFLPATVPGVCYEAALAVFGPASVAADCFKCFRFSAKTNALLISRGLRDFLGFRLLSSERITESLI